MGFGCETTFLFLHSLLSLYFKYCEINNITSEKQVADGSILGTFLWPNKIRFLYCNIASFKVVRFLGIISFIHLENQNKQKILGDLKKKKYDFSILNKILGN